MVNENQLFYLHGEDVDYSRSSVWAGFRFWEQKLMFYKQIFCLWQKFVTCFVIFLLNQQNFMSIFFESTQKKTEMLD